MIPLSSRSLILQQNSDCPQPTTVCNHPPPWYCSNQCSGGDDYYSGGVDDDDMTDSAATSLCDACDGITGDDDAYTSYGFYYNGDDAGPHCGFSSSLTAKTWSVENV